LQPRFHRSVIYWLQLNTTNLLLQTLACVDTVYLVACLFIQTAKTLVDSTGWLPAVFVAYVPRLEPYIWPAASCAQTATVWTVLLLTADRYAAVCYPFDARLRSLRRARRREEVPRCRASLRNSAAESSAA